MSRKIIFIFVVIVTASTADLQTAAITVYRNPEFFRHLSEEFNNHLHKFTPDSPGADEYHPVDDSNYFHQYNTEFNPEYSPSELNEDNHAEQHRDEEDNDNDNEHTMEHDEDDGQHYNNEEDEGENDYKYPGEPKKPNPTAQPDVHVHYDPSPDFDPPPRDVKPSEKKPKARPPFGHPLRAQDKYHEPTAPNHHPEYEYDHGLLESIPDVNNRPVSDPEEYLGYENIPYPSRNHLHETIRETKKGTREFLKHNTLPANHELEDLRSMQRQPVRVSCATRIKAKKPRTYIAYKVRPIYPRYRIVPLSPNRLTTVYFVKRNALMKRRRNAPNPTSDDSAYLINSAFDDDYQRILKAN